MGKRMTWGIKRARGGGKRCGREESGGEVGGGGGRLNFDFKGDVHRGRCFLFDT